MKKVLRWVVQNPIPVLVGGCLLYGCWHWASTGRWAFALSTAVTFGLLVLDMLLVDSVKFYKEAWEEAQADRDAWQTTARKFGQHLLELMPEKQEEVTAETGRASLVQ